MADRVTINSGIAQSLQYAMQQMFGDDDNEALEYRKERDAKQDRETLENNILMGTLEAGRALNLDNTSEIIAYKKLTDDLVEAGGPGMEVLKSFTTAYVPSWTAAMENNAKRYSLHKNVDNMVGEINKLDIMDVTDKGAVKHIVSLGQQLEKQFTDANIPISKVLEEQIDEQIQFADDAKNVINRFNRYDMNPDKAGFQMPKTFFGADLSNPTYAGVTQFLNIAVESAELGNMSKASLALDAAAAEVVNQTREMNKLKAEMEAKPVEPTYNLEHFSGGESVTGETALGIWAPYGSTLAGIAKKVEDEKTGLPGQMEEFYASQADSGTLSETISKFSTHSMNALYDVMSVNLSAFSPQLLQPDYYLDEKGKKDKTRPKTYETKVNEQLLFEFLYETKEGKTGKDYSKRTRRTQEDAMKQIFKATKTWKWDKVEADKKQVAVADIYQVLQALDFARIAGTPDYLK